MRLFRYVVPCAVLTALGCSGGEEIGAISTNSTSCGDDASSGTGGGLVLDASVDATATAEAGTDSASGADAQGDASGIVASMDAGTVSVPAVVDAGSSNGTTLYALGTGLGSGNVGPDGMIEQALGANGLFAQIAVPRSNGYMAGATWEPISQQFYEFGNTDGANPAQSYSPATNAWTNLYNLPGSNGGGEACVGAANGLVQIMGGYNDKTNAIANVYSYNPIKQTYTAKAALPTAVGDCFAVTLGSLVYHGGGCSNNAGTKVTCQSTWYRYDPASDVRTALASLPVALGQSATAYFNGSIYVIGGYVGAASSAGTTKVFAYSIANNTWTQKNDFPTAVAASCAAAWNGTIYVLGGFTAAGFPNATKNVYSYNAAADSWSLAPFSLTQATEVSACGPAPYPKGFNGASDVTAAPRAPRSTAPRALVLATP